MLDGYSLKGRQCGHRMQSILGKDVRTPNILFNAVVKGNILMDFERALLLERPCRPLAQLVPNRRRRRPEERESVSRAGKQSNSRQIHLQHTQYTETGDNEDSAQEAICFTEKADSCLTTCGLWFMRCTLDFGRYPGVLCRQLGKIVLDFRVDNMLP